MTPLAEYLCRITTSGSISGAPSCAGGAASDLLENDEEIYALSDLLDRAAETGTLPDMPLYRVTEALETDGTAIPALALARPLRTDRPVRDGRVHGRKTELLSRRAA